MSKYLLAVDPGKLQCGLAIFSGSTLVSATLARNEIDKPGSDGPQVWRNTARAVQDAWYEASHPKNPEDGFEVVSHLVLEVPQIYRSGLQKGDQADIGALFGVDGAIAALFDCPVTHYKPEQWGGSVPKKIKNARTLKRLTPDELQAIDPKVPKSLLHNVLDAAAIGLFYLGRYR